MMIVHFICTLEHNYNYKEKSTFSQSNKDQSFKTQKTGNHHFKVPMENILNKKVYLLILFLIVNMVTF